MIIKCCFNVWWFFIVIAIVFGSSFTFVFARDLSEIIANDRRLSEFNTLLQESEVAKTLMRHMSNTVFAPTNDAFAKYQGIHRRSTDLISYHIVKSSITSNTFPSSVPSEVIGGLPIWIRKNFNPFQEGSNKQYEYYANNARIIEMDIKGRSVEGFEQVLHIIDEVLDPILPVPDDPNYRNPSAHRILTNPRIYDISTDMTEFERKVQYHNKQIVLQGGEGHTFFFPINGNNEEVWNRVDDKVIDAHIIPGKVFFTRAFPSDSQESMSFTEMLKTLILVKNETSSDQRSYELQAQSNTVVGYQNYPKGVVVAKILKPNIPVRNGVVHLIENPLVVIDKNVFQLLQQNQNLREFNNLLANRGGDVGLSEDVGRFQVSLFAPSNEAFKTMDKVRLNMILNNPEKVLQMLKLHLVQQKVSSEMIVQGLITSVATKDRFRKLHFSHSLRNITVVGGGVNATIVTADIGASNGYIHIIDKILGIPYHTIFEKLQSDNGLSKTFNLGTQRGYNSQFKDLHKQFTYFVPHNEAWDKIRSQFPSEYAKLFQGEYTYQVEKILERHLHVNHAYSLDDLVRMKEIQMVHGRFQIDGDQMTGKYYVRWEGEVAEIMDSDVETTNGIVHVIRSVLFKRRDLTNEATSQTHFASFATLLLSALLVKFVV